jgi:acetolactate synthase-1/2/3 large subunit
VDIDAAEIGKVKQVHWSHVGDAGTALRDLLHAGKSFKRDFAPWRKHLHAMKETHPLAYDRSSDLIQPPHVLELLNEVTKGDAIICTGVGQHQMWSAQYCEVHQPRSFITSGSMGTMGFGLPAAIGAQIGRPDKLVIDVDGDGSLRMNVGELETATTYGVPVKVLLLNNRGDGMVLQWQRLYYGKRFCGTDKTLRKKDFVKAAEAEGFEFAKRVREKSEIKKALAKFIEYDGPAFLEVITDQSADVFPMVGPGQGYKDMVTGPHISARAAAPPHPVDIDATDSF